MPALEKLFEVNSLLKLYLHGTGRQWDDPRRPWVVREKTEFAAACRRTGFVVSEQQYFGHAETEMVAEANASEEHGLKEHFGILDVFES
eukprot:SAG31_NODE_2096_length_6455_cov_2.145060_9_plen_89_part_00